MGYMKLNGYRATHRNKWLFIQYGILSVQELSLLEFYADTFCINTKQPEYGEFKVNFDELKIIFNCKSDTTIRNWHNKLLKVGFIKKSNKKNKYNLVCCGRYINPSKAFVGEAHKYKELEENQPIKVVLQSFGIEFQSNEQKLQPVGKENNEKDNTTIQTNIVPTDAYKSEYIGSTVKIVDLKARIRTQEEYERMYQESGCVGLTPEDMKLADEAAHEIRVIENEEQEKETVKDWFDGDWNKYRGACRMVPVSFIENL